MHRRSFLRLGLNAAAAPALAAAVVTPLSARRDPEQTGATATPVSRRADLFLSHRIGTDHAESLSVLDMIGDGRPDIVSGAYWYENPGALGVEWKRHQAPEDACSTDMLVQIRWHGRTMTVPLSQLVGLDVDESTAEDIGDWHYWVAQGYCF